MTKVKMFNNYSYNYNLEDEINDWLVSNAEKFDVIDIKYSVEKAYHNIVEFAMIIYKERENENE